MWDLIWGSSSSMKSNLQLEMFKQMDEKVLWEYCSFAIFYFIKIAQNHWTTKWAGWLTGDLQMLLCVLLICSQSNHSVCASHLVQLKKMTQLFYLDDYNVQLECFVLTAIIPHWKMYLKCNSSRCIYFINVRTLQYWFHYFQKLPFSLEHDVLLALL